MLAAGLALVVALWLDALRALPPRSPLLALRREAPPAFSVGRVGQVAYRWVNASRRPVRLRLREVRPDILGGTQPPRGVRLPARGPGTHALPRRPAPRGREPAGA